MNSLMGDSAGERGYPFILDSADFSEGLGCLRRLAFSAQDHTQLIMHRTVRVVSKNLVQHRFRLRVVFFVGIGAAQLPIGVPEVGPAADSGLKMRNRFGGMTLRDKHGSQLAVRFRMEWIELQLARQLPESIVSLTVLPVEMTEPVMGTGKIGLGDSHRAIFADRLFILFAVRIELAK